MYIPAGTLEVYKYTSKVSIILLKKAPNLYLPSLISIANIFRHTCKCNKRVSLFLIIQRFYTLQIMLVVHINLFDALVCFYVLCIDVRIYATSMPFASIYHINPRTGPIPEILVISFWVLTFWIHQIPNTKFVFFLLLLSPFKSVTNYEIAIFMTTMIFSQTLGVL